MYYVCRYAGSVHAWVSSTRLTTITVEGTIRRTQDFMVWRNLAHSSSGKGLTCMMSHIQTCSWTLKVFPACPIWLQWPGARTGVKQQMKVICARWLQVALSWEICLSLVSELLVDLQHWEGACQSCLPWVWGSVEGVYFRDGQLCLITHQLCKLTNVNRILWTSFLYYTRNIVIYTTYNYCGDKVYEPI